MINSATSKFAVVGSGPAGLGVILALLDHGLFGRVTVFDIDRSLDLPTINGEPTPKRIVQFYDSVYEEIWQLQKRKFPPPKTHFAKTLPKFPINGKGKIFQSDTVGGLSNFWGATALPFTDRELFDWSISRKDLDPHYRRLADLAGIAGMVDALNNYFGDDFSNRPAMQITSAFKKMIQSVNDAPACSDFDALAGVNRCMLETRTGFATSCVSCGECLAGCFQDSIFSTRRVISKLVSQGAIQLVSGKVLSFDANAHSLVVKANLKSETYGPYDRIYLSAGCPNTTEITLRSLGLKSADDMYDNAVFVFPVLHFGHSDRKVAHENYVSLSNMIIGLVPKDTELPFAQVQLYTNFDYMWRYNMPPYLWPFAKNLVAWSRDHLFWGRLYLHSNLSQAYSISMENDEIKFHYSRGVDRGAVGKIMPVLRHALNRQGFYIPPIQPLYQNANSHYASTMPIGGSRVPVSPASEVSPGIYLCDSASFPDLPAVSLTFTIMANAHRVASLSL